jgi:hypothetical protein
MIDTLKVSLSDYSIASEHEIIVQPSGYNPSTGEVQATYPLWHDGRGYVEGSRAFHNSDLCNLTIKPVSPLEPDKVGCFVQFSVPKVATGSNYYPADEQATAGAFKTVEKYLKSVGVKTNINNASLSRVDTFKTVQASEPYQSYHSVLSMLQGQRMAKRDYGTTFLWSNTQQEICVYDKLAEMQQRKCDVSRLPDNSIRFEHRLLKGKKVRDSLSMSTVKEIVSNPREVSNAYRQAMEKQLFKHSIKDVEMLTVSEIEEQLGRIMRDSISWGFRRWMCAVGLVHGIDDIEAVRKAITAVAPNRTSASRMKRQLDQAVMDAAALKLAGRNKRSMAELYSELQQGVLTE